MRILALQLKRIGDLILTTPALAALRARWPEAHLALAVSEGCAPLLPAISQIDTNVVFGRGRGFAPWQQAISGAWSLCLDFTGNDRSALATALSRGKERATFAGIQRNKMRSLAYTRLVDSPVRDRHTVDHYLDLVREVTGSEAESSAPSLLLPAEVLQRSIVADLRRGGDYVVIHPFTARPEKNWLPERWAEVITQCQALGFICVLTGGDSPEEKAHHAQIIGQTEARMRDTGIAPHDHKLCSLGGRTDLLSLAALVAQARLLVSCDTAAVHLAAAFRTPQIALFGPTNPFHWQPRHDRAVVISAAQPEAPLTAFQPRMKGAPMERISTAVVIRATETLLAASR